MLTKMPLHHAERSCQQNVITMSNHMCAHKRKQNLKNEELKFKLDLIWQTRKQGQLPPPPKPAFYSVSLDS